MSILGIDSEAWADIASVLEYLAGTVGNVTAAKSFLDEFDRKCEVYSRQPGMGDLRDDLGLGYRSFTFRRWYVAVYQPLTEGIRVRRVFDGRSDYARHFDV